MKYKLLIGVMAALVAGSTAQATTNEMIQLDHASDRVQALLNQDRPLVIAHRGYKAAAPENTLPAFSLGVLAQADLVELDYHHSADGVPVVFHDRTLDRTTDAVARWGEEDIGIASKTAEQLRELDAGGWFHPRFAGVEIPTLVEALNVIQPSSITLIERKKGDPRTLTDLLKREGVLGDVVIQAFDWEFIAACNALIPGMALGALGPPRRADGSPYPVEERFLNSAFLDRIEQTGATVVGWNDQVTAEAIGEAHRRGLQVWIYTINDLDKAVSLLAMGVDGIITDNPAIGWKALAVQDRDRR